jgi:hypothetical protein
LLRTDAHTHLPCPVQQLSAISTRCNAGKIAAARRAAAVRKYNTLFPCTRTAATNATTLLGLDTCLTGAGGTSPPVMRLCSRLRWC